MTGIIAAAVAAFFATGIDEMVVLTLLFTQAKDKQSVRDVYIGQLAGMIALLSISTLAAYGLSFFPEKWVGVLGLLPIFMGIRIWIAGDNDDKEEEDVRGGTYRFNSLIVSVAVLAIAGGAEELAVYIPFFSALTQAELFIVWVTFLVLVPIWCSICRGLSQVKTIRQTAEKYQRTLVPAVLIILGVLVMAENHTLEPLFNILGAGA